MAERPWGFDSPLSHFRAPSFREQHVPLSTEVPLLSLAFFLSGFSGLLYQTVWQRMLAPFAGSDVLAATLVVASFMGGLGIGSLAGGALTTRWSARGQLMAFALVEAGVAGCALLSTDVLYHGLYRGAVTWADALWIRSLVVWTVLLAPTLLMGMSLPLLSAAAASGSSDPAREIGGLYGWNTIGASLGALVTVWLIFRVTDQRTALALGAGLTLAAAIAALTVARSRRGSTARAVATAPSRHGSGPPLPFGAWVTLFGLSGFIALSLEIVWFRILGVIVKSSATTFGTLLAIYLAGIGGGALLARRWIRQPPTPMVLVSMAAVPCYAGLALAVLPGWSGDGSSMLAAHVARYDPWELTAVGWTEFLYVHVLVPLVLVGPPTLVMGATFVWLQRAAQTDPERVGLRVGWLQAANLAGAVLGAALTGLVGLDWLGTTGVMKLLVATGLVPAALALWLSGGRRAAPALAGGALVFSSVIWTIPPAHAFWQALHGAARRGFLVAEDRTGVAAVRDEPMAAKTVFINGLGQSRLPYGGIHVTLGALPVLVHQHPRRVLIIGLGSGATLFGAAARPETERIDLVELIAPQQRLLERMRAEYAYPALSRVLDDRRIVWHTGDGRAFLQRAMAGYDVIEADALRPTSPYAGLLYSRQYFELVRSRLAPRGLAVTWNPTTRVAATFAAVFPHVVEARDVLLGSNQPIAIDLGPIRARAMDAAVQAHFADAGLDPVRIAEAGLAGAVHRRGGHASDGDLNEDLYPRDEFRVP